MWDCSLQRKNGSIMLYTIQSRRKSFSNKQVIMVTSTVQQSYRLASFPVLSRLQVFTSILSNRDESCAPLSTSPCLPYQCHVKQVEVMSSTKLHIEFLGEVWSKKKTQPKCWPAHNLNKHCRLPRVSSFCTSASGM